MSQPGPAASGDAAPPAAPDGTRELSWRVPVRIAAAYALAGGVWILVSDRWLDARRGQAPDWDQTFRGWGFVVASALIIVLLVRHYWRRSLRAHAAEEAQQKQARQAAAQAAGILESISDAFLALDTELRVTYFNTAAERQLGRRREDVLGRELFEAFPEAKGSVFEVNYRQALLDRQPRVFETFFEAARYRNWYQVRVYPQREGIAVYFQVVTEQKRSEERLRLTQFAVDRAFFLVVWVDAQGKVVYANEAAGALWRQPPLELAGRPIWELDPAISAADWRGFWEEVRSRKGLTQVSLLKNRARGQTIHLETTWSHLEMATVELLVGHGQDISERSRLQAQLRQAQKMEAVGRLAGGIAHDFNNILAAILMQLGLLRTNSSLSPAVRDGVEELLGSARRAANLTRQLLMFGRRQMLQIGPASLNQVLLDLERMLSRLLGERVQVSLEAKAEPGWVLADVTMLEQVVVNLAVNGRDAMPAGGRLSLRTCNAADMPATLPPQDAPSPGPFVCLSVSDTGVGMDEGTLSRIFEPFFSTKQEGKGTGLGLATVYGIVRQHGGWVEVESAPGQGTTFRVYIPASTKPPVIPPAQLGASAAGGGSETILLAEDDPKVRKMLAACLRQYGYAVLEAGDALEAAALWDEHHARIDLLFTDMVMPGNTTGLELAAQLRHRNPSLPAIITSGYSHESIMPGSPGEPSMLFLVKPYDVPTVAATVRQALDNPMPRTVHE